MKRLAFYLLVTLVLVAVALLGRLALRMEEPAPNHPDQYRKPQGTYYADFPTPARCPECGRFMNINLDRCERHEVTPEVAGQSSP